MHKLLELATYLGLQVMALVLVGVLLALCVLAVKAWDWLLRATQGEKRRNNIPGTQFCDLDWCVLPPRHPGRCEF